MSVDALVQRAINALRAGVPADAVSMIETAPAAQRNTQAAQRTLAAACAEMGNLEAAQRAIERALQATATTSIEPATRALAGRIALDVQQHGLAFAHFAMLLKAAPAHLPFWRYLWRAANTPALRDQALTLAEVNTLDASADTRIAWGVSLALLARSRVTEALALAEQTLRRHPDNAEAGWLWTRRVIDEAPLRALAELARVPVNLPGPLDPDLADSLLALPEHYSDDDAINAWRTRYSDGLTALSMQLAQASLASAERAALIRHTAFQLAYHGRDDVELQTRRGELLHALMRPCTPAIAPRTRVADAPLRVAFASKHIRDCTVGHYFKRFMAGLAEADDAIEIHVYACGPGDRFTDDVAASITTFSRFEDNPQALQAMANAIACDAPDVLIYPEIGMEPVIEKLAAMRLAPLQCALWGHPVTTGLPTIDVFLSAAALEPDGAHTHYRERLHLLPGLGTCYPRPPAASALSREGLGLPADTPLLVCAQAPFKWSLRFTQTVVQILKQAPTAKLVVFESPVAGRTRVFREYLQHVFSAQGLDASSRIIWQPQRSRSDFLAVLAECDVALDSFGFSGGNTSLDALSVGLPLVTLPGEFMRGRQTFAMLKALRSEACDALIARDETHYVELVTGLLDDALSRAAAREAIAANVPKLFDDSAPVEALRAWLLEQRNGVLSEQ